MIAGRGLHVRHNLLPGPRRRLLRWPLYLLLPDVSYTVKGTATNGTDDVPLKGTAKIKAGKTSEPIKDIPQGNLAEGPRKPSC